MTSDDGRRWTVIRNSRGVTVKVILAALAVLSLGVGVANA
jgi:hypothetical protein